jgi:hypothetical protein
MHEPDFPVYKPGSRIVVSLGSGRGAGADGDDQTGLTPISAAC